ncbi:MAG: hypothetical protein GX995_08270 [Clostridiales bacterium]|nr:hypothetical protein [Clostridiales bacterium]
MTRKKRLVTLLLIMLIAIAGFLYFYMKGSNEPDYKGTFVNAYVREEVL